MDIDEKKKPDTGEEILKENITVKDKEINGDR